MPGFGLSSTAATGGKAYPMYVLRVADVIALERLPVHDDLKAAGTLVEWDASMGACIFVSQTWLSFKHPDDKENSKLKCLQAILRRAAAGKLTVHPNAQAEMIWGAEMKIPASKLAQLEYVWFDICSVPQHDRDLQMKAIASIGAYVQDSTFFMVLAGAWRHDDTGAIRDIRGAGVVLIVGVGIGFGVQVGVVM